MVIGMGRASDRSKLRVLTCEMSQISPGLGVTAPAETLARPPVPHVSEATEFDELDLLPLDDREQRQK